MSVAMPLQIANAMAASEFERVGVPFVDVTPAFEAAEDPRWLFLFPLDAHTSEAGHALTLQSFNVVADEEDAARYRFRLVLTRVSADDRYTRGSVAITVQGRSGDRMRELEWRRIGGSDVAARFQFRNFHRIDGRLFGDQQLG